MAFDLTTLTFVLAFLAGCCAMAISSWLLRMMLTNTQLTVVMILDIVFAWTGLFWHRLYRLCRSSSSSSASRTNAVDAVHICYATGLSLVVVVSYLILTSDQDVTLLIGSEDFVRILIAVIGLSLATSLLWFLLHYGFTLVERDLILYGRRLKHSSGLAPQAKLVFVEDLDIVAPGECAVCLDALATLPAHAAYVRKGQKANLHKKGLLKLPCGHIFHGDCAAKWLEREVKCPMCRGVVPKLTSCERLVLKGPPPTVELSRVAPEGKASPETEAHAAIDIEEAAADGSDGSISRKANAASPTTVIPTSGIEAEADEGDTGNNDDDINENDNDEVADEGSAHASRRRRSEDEVIVEFEDDHDHDDDDGREPFSSSPSQRLPPPQSPACCSFVGQSPAMSSVSTSASTPAERGAPGAKRTPKRLIVVGKATAAAAATTDAVVATHTSSTAEPSDDPAAAAQTDQDFGRKLTDLLPPMMSLPSSDGDEDILDIDVWLETAAPSTAGWKDMEYTDTEVIDL